MTQEQNIKEFINWFSRDGDEEMIFNNALKEYLKQTFK